MQGIVYYASSFTQIKTTKNLSNLDFNFVSIGFF